VPSSLKGCNISATQKGPIYKCPEPFMELDYDESIRQTKLLYENMYPGDEFLPKAPEPEEIVIGDEDDAAESNVNLGVLADLIPTNESSLTDDTIKPESTQSTDDGPEKDQQQTEI
jgi:hypothetical protein